MNNRKMCEDSLETYMNWRPCCWCGIYILENDKNIYKKQKQKARAVLPFCRSENCKKNISSVGPVDAWIILGINKQK